MRALASVRDRLATAHGIVLSESSASRASSSAQRLAGAGRLVANASICCVTVQVQVPVQPGRSQGRSASFVFAKASRHGSHIDDAGSFGSAAPRPPSFAPFADVIDSQVRVHPVTEQGDDFAPNRSASVNPARPMAG